MELEICKCKNVDHKTKIQLIHMADNYLKAFEDVST